MFGRELFLRCFGVKLSRRLLVLAFVAIAVQQSFGEVVDEMEEEKKPKAEDVSMAATLIGSISFIMCLYYFTNWPDPDIKKYSWEIISNTISIFCAVLLFSAFNDMVEAYVIEAYSLDKLGEFVVDMLHMLFWFAFLQFLLWLFAARNKSAFIHAHVPKAEVDEELERRELNLKCYATLMAHLTGFASINAWGSLQQLSFFAEDAVLAQLSVPIAFCGQYCLQRLTNCMREWVSNLDDDITDPFEEMWDDETEDAENDIMALTLSFMTVNSLRFLVVGCMPSNEGKEESPRCPADSLYNHTLTEKVILWVCAYAFTGGVFYLHYYFPAAWEEKELADEVQLKKRVAVDVMASVSMCFSWCQFYGAQMALAGMGFFHHKEEVLAVALAISVSLYVFVLIVVLDWFADQDWTDERCDKGIRATIDACALLVGFAWEQCFDQSVDSLAMSTKGWVLLDPHRSKLLLSIFCAALLVPAWKWYMLPYILEQGWRFGYVLKAEDLERVVDELHKIEEEKEAEREKHHEASEKHHEEEHSEADEEEGATNRILSLERACQKTEALIANRRRSSSGHPDPASKAHGNGKLYESLAGDEPSALKREIAELRCKLAQAERERDVALHEVQNAAAYQMEAMSEYMKKFNLTVTRIPFT